VNLLRHPSNPLLLPLPDSEWESNNVFNPGVVYHDGLFHMLYRAQGSDWVSRIGYAVSRDGVNWNRLRQPVLTPLDPSESRGVEDPRVTFLEGRFYMCYTAFGEFQGTGTPTHQGSGITPMIAVSDNLITWERLSAITIGEDNKDHLLFPRKINNRYVALHRRWPDVWLAYSDDLLHWPEDDMQLIFRPRAEPAWDSVCVGANGIPIETEHGWLMLYHGYDPMRIYKFGVCLLDLDNPSQVLQRCVESIFEPHELWELHGHVLNVVFSNANVLVDGTVYIYYGGADHVIGLATCELDALLGFALQG
jgi:beta-1,2-mannobiose phosphorylase / 1,2-beta-oligomannan phosphorylase